MVYGGYGRQPSERRRTSDGASEIRKIHPGEFQITENCGSPEGGPVLAAGVQLSAAKYTPLSQSEYGAMNISPIEAATCTLFETVNPVEPLVPTG